MPRPVSPSLSLPVSKSPRPSSFILPPSSLSSSRALQLARPLRPALDATEDEEAERYHHQPHQRQPRQLARARGERSARRQLPAVADADELTARRQSVGRGRDDGERL